MASLIRASDVTSDYVIRFRTFIRTWLARFITDRSPFLRFSGIGTAAQVIDAFTDTSAMAVWIRSATQESVEYDSDKNYEDMEFLGDSILKSTTALFLLRNVRGVHKSQATDITQNVMSREPQAVYTEMMGLQQFARTARGIGGSEMTTGVKGDLFEAFVGALVTIGDSLFEGLGFLVANEFTKLIFSLKPIDPENSLIAPKTELEQLFKGLLGRDVVDKPVLNVAPLGKKWVATITLTNQQLQFLNSHGNRSIFVHQIGLAEDIDQAVAEKAAYAAAAKVLRGAGFNARWSRQLKRDRELRAADSRDTYETLLKAIAPLGFTSIDFRSPGKEDTGKDKVTIMIGRRDDGIEETLYSEIERAGGFRANAHDMHIRLMKLYLQSVLNR